MSGFHNIQSGVPTGECSGSCLHTLSKADLSENRRTMVATCTNDIGILAIHEDSEVPSNNLQHELLEIQCWPLN